MSKIDPVFDLAAWSAELDRHGADTGPFLVAWATALAAHRRGQAQCVIEQVPRVVEGLRQVARDLDERRAMLDRIERRVKSSN